MRYTRFELSDFPIVWLLTSDFDFKRHFYQQKFKKETQIRTIWALHFNLKLKFAASF